MREFNCPACDANDWDELENRVYRRAQGAHGDDYVAKRLKVLFECWCPTEQEFLLAIRACRSCGFVCYSPRPAEEDVDSKYRWLNRPENADVGPTSADGLYQRNRARRLAHILRAKVNLASGVQVLDYGGGDGRLMAEVAKTGASCFVVDYNKQTCPWVTRLGDTLEGVSSLGRRFDICVLSHVLEHVVQPVPLLAGLKGLLKEDGRIFCEVPLEVWRYLPRLDEPVTHVNFFTPNSLRETFCRAGYTVEAVHLREYWAGLPNRMALAIVCWARTGCQRTSAQRTGSDLSKWLHPRLVERINTAVRCPRLMVRNIVHRLKVGKR